jgi:hypothetical protein
MSIVAFAQFSFPKTVAAGGSYERNELNLNTQLASSTLICTGLIFEVTKETNAPSCQSRPHFLFASRSIALSPSAQFTIYSTALPIVIFFPFILLFVLFCPIVDPIVSHPDYPQSIDRHRPVGALPIFSVIHSPTRISLIVVDILRLPVKAVKRHHPQQRRR